MEKSTFGDESSSTTSALESFPGEAELRRRLEAVRQELHDARRGHQTALDVQRHLAAELDSAAADNRVALAARDGDIAALREELQNARADRTALLAERDELATCLHEARSDLRVARERERELEREKMVRDESPRPATTGARTGDQMEETRAVEDALREMREAQETAARWREEADALGAELTQARALITEKVEEARAAREREEEALAEIATIRLQLARPLPADHAVKGNSLFAEVDDKRQEMAQSLLQMKQKNAQLKRELSSTTMELERLQRERNDAEHLHYDQELIDRYCERITVLEAAVERQRRDACRGLSLDHDSAPALRAHLKSRCAQLTDELVARSASELAHAAQVRLLRAQLARLRSAADA